MKNLFALFVLLLLAGAGCSNQPSSNEPNVQTVSQAPVNNSENIQTATTTDNGDSDFVIPDYIDAALRDTSGSDIDVQSRLVRANQRLIDEASRQSQMGHTRWLQGYSRYENNFQILLGDITRRSIDARQWQLDQDRLNNQ